MDQLTQFLQPIAAFVDGFGLPAPIIHWGHPLMMGIVVFVMGSYAGVKGWQGRLQTDPAIASENRAAHAKVAALMFVFIVLGSTGGTLSMVMQGESIWASPHFLTGACAILLLGTNATLSLTNFWGDKSALRKSHAYLGSAALILLIVHTVLGLNLGLSI
ncbi:hypothetical protein C1752_01212 [Acaryochloris thomasi RCC1774]|uniref:DUF4079 domain-containing protein n=1 Tax=Acaryochloris thomasi RCC1774 TaxID=1764569 RepID=A0A2W1JM16_9CYAN|nr:DUF4079 domain-containing protein [Acaryochloris thomasi]PZD74358.1 hypothetical protein C1752_01212 [Acaryochloris thomasi RCC1774]